MKKYIVTFLFISLFLFISPIAKAETSPSTDYRQQVILLLQQEIKLLQDQLNTILASSSVPNYVVAPDAPQNKFNTQTGQLNPNYVGYTSSNILPIKPDNVTLPSGAVIDKSGNTIIPAKGYNPNTEQKCTINVSETTKDNISFAPAIKVTWSAPNFPGTMTLYSNIASLLGQPINCSSGQCGLEGVLQSSSGTEVLSDPWANQAPTLHNVDYKIIMSNGDSCESLVAIPI